MNYKEKYNQALERARDYHSKDYMLINNAIENIFPELKENEDEKNIKDLIDELKCSLRAANCQNEVCNGGHEKRIALLEWSINWLEKQGKTLDADKVIEWLRVKAPKWLYDMVYPICLDVDVEELVEQFKKDFEL